MQWSQPWQGHIIGLYYAHHPCLRTLHCTFFDVRCELLCWEWAVMATATLRIRLRLTAVMRCGHTVFLHSKSDLYYVVLRSQCLLFKLKTKNERSTRSHRRSPFTSCFHSSSSWDQPTRTIGPQAARQDRGGSIYDESLSRPFVLYFHARHDILFF